MKMNLRKLLVLSAAIFGIGGNADVFAVNDESVTDERMANLIYNPNFSLVKPNTYSELIGWKVYDANVSAPRTGGMNASCATADPTWTKFNNAKGSVNLDGEENRFSTAAMFKFPEIPNKFCSSSSRYVYGDVDMDDTGALWLSSNSCFEFSAQLGYLNENEKGSVTFEIVKYDGQVVKTFTYTPTVCVSDTTKTPEVIRFSFLTDCFNTEYYGQYNYRMQYYRMQYKIVVRNTIPGDHWTLVMSNLKLCEIKPQNLIYNPNFSLVRENSYCELTGWEVYDPSVSNPRTGGMGATSATSDRMWTKFYNAKGSVNLDGEENTFSTAARFMFLESPNSFCSSSSQYVYGNSTGYELMLEPNQLYRFYAELGYENEGEKGSVIFEIVNNKTGHKVLSKIIESQVCFTDTTQLPQSFLTYFKTDDASANESYKLVVRNSNPNDYWTLVMSNLALRKWYDNPNDEEPITNEPTDSVNIDITEVNKEESENTTTPVVSQTEEGEPCYVYEPEDATKNQTISFNIPVEVVVAGNKYYVVIVLVPADEAKARPTYLTFELKGVPHKLYDRPSVPADNVTNVLGSYLYSGEKEERLVYEFTSDVDFKSASINISTDNPKDGNTNYTSAIGLKQISFAAENDNSTAIETVASEQTDVIPVGIYNASGVKVSSFQKGVNIVRFSDGSVRKVQY